MFSFGLLISVCPREDAVEFKVFREVVNFKVLSGSGQRKGKDHVAEKQQSLAFAGVGQMLSCFARC